MIKYLTYPSVAAIIAAGKTYQKAAVTLLRKPSAAELGTTMTTFVAADGGVRKESESVISADVTIARNPKVIGKTAEGADIFNEWPIGNPTVIKNYGEAAFNSLGELFVGYRKKALVKAAPLDGAILTELKVDGDVLNIAVDWSKDPMIAHKGDFLTDQGYSISAADMADYVEVAA